MLAMGNWKLYRTDKGRELIRDDCTCIDHCKEVARKRRKKGHGLGYDQEMTFEISDPINKPRMRSLQNTGWRMKWEWVHDDRL